MTRPLSVGLEAHVALETTTLAFLWRITRVDAEVLRYTDHDQDIVYLGDTYKSSNAFAPTSISTKDDLSTSNLDVVGILTFTEGSPDISEPDLAAGVYDYAGLEIMTINYADTTQGVVLMLKGWLGRVTLRNGQFVAEVRSLAQKLETNIGRLYTPSCDAILGDARCTKSIGAFTFTGTVTDVTTNGEFTSDDLTQETGYFTGGQITFTSGDNDGLSMEIKDFSDTTVSLSLPMPNTIVVDDTFSIVAGCDKTKATCISKFDNLINFRGFPDIPGTDKILETAGTFEGDA